MKFNRKKAREHPEISTASLPDIVFMLLFFFMVSTVMRKNEIPHHISLPNVQDVSIIKTDNEIRISVLNKGQNIIVQGKKTNIHNVEKVIALIASTLTMEEKEKIEVLIFADEMSPMENLINLKTALRKNNLRKINYMAENLVVLNK